MENTFIPGFVFDNKFFNFMDDFAYSILLVVSTSFVLLLCMAYKKVRRKFPLKVNCWFCNNYASVPYELSNGWDCPHCQQYNGFNKDGDYNKVIPEQYNHKLNEQIFNTLRKSVESCKTNLETNGFCKLCNINQQLKVQQLALFVPLNEKNYYEEIEQYREKLEKAYHLCSKCEKTLQETIKKQEYKLMQNRLNSHKSALSQGTKNLTRFNRDYVLIFIKKNGLLGVKVICISTATLLFLTLLIYFETEHKFLKLTSFEFIVLESLLPILKVFLKFLEQIYAFKREISFAGLLCSFLSLSKNQVKQKCITLLSWGLLHISLWSTMSGLQLLICGVCLFLNIQETKYKFMYLSKKSLPKKSSFQPAKTVLPEVFSSLREENKHTNKLHSILLKEESFESLGDETDALETQKTAQRNQTSKNLPHDEEKQETRHQKSEIESLNNEDKEKVDSMGLNSSFLKNSFFEMDKNYNETNCSFSEVYNTLNNLKLGSKHKKSNKPPNFLFANHNFSDVKNSSIIKPAKFIKNLNSTSWTESNECNSRSSTPSSGYSSQKPVRIDTNRYNFSTSVSPISLNPFNRHSPNNSVDFYDANHGFYNGVNCFTPGFIPFQQYPSSLNRTTIYTCMRPTNFPFPFSPWQGYSGQKFSPTSARFSDSSDCDNIFQESSKRFERNQKWFKLKTLFYSFSIFLNFIIIVSLIFFTSTGIILIDWKLPQFNFFL